MTEWTTIPNHPNYQITKDGRVRSIDRVSVDKNGRSRRLKGRELSPSLAGTKTEKHPGYYMVGLGAGVSKTVHSLVAATFLGPANGRHVRHLNGDPTDNRLENLAYDETGTQNAQDAVEQKRLWQQQKTHCPREHPLEEPNLVAHQKRLGWRDCLACKKARERARYLDNPDLKALADEEFSKLVRSVD